jgi:hypothetical protein
VTLGDQPQVTPFLAERPLPAGPAKVTSEGNTMSFVTIATQAFPGARPYALTMRDCRNSANCFGLTVYTDDLPGLQEYVEAHNARDGEFRVDLSDVRARNGRSASRAGRSAAGFLQQ